VDSVQHTGPFILLETADFILLEDGLSRIVIDG
jgi:hypothetical protein